MWECAIEACGRRTERVEDLLVHQANDHERHTCEVCGATVPAGYFAIRHVFDEHGRAGYVRAYGAEAAHIRAREGVREAIEATADLDDVAGRIQGSVDVPGAGRE